MVTKIGTIATFDNVVLELGKLEERRELDSSQYNVELFYKEEQPDIYPFHVAENTTIFCR